MGYRRAWVLVCVAGCVVTAGVVTLMVLGIVFGNDAGKVVFGVIGLLGLTGCGFGFGKLWRMRPSTRAAR